MTYEYGKGLVPFLTTNMRPDGTPRVSLLRLGVSTFPTPAAAASRMSLSPALVGAMAQLSGAEGSVRRGEVSAVPAAGTIAYVQYLFASADSAGAALLPRGVAVFVGGRVGVGTDVGTALRAGAASREESVAAENTSASLAQARAAFLALDSAVRAGDWARFGRAYENLRRALGAPPPGGRRP